MEPILTLQQICKSYGKHQVLKDISLHIPKGSIYGLIGKNGAGKTTLMRIIAGLQEASSGSFSLGKNRIGAASAKSRASSSLNEPHSGFTSAMQPVVPG